MPLKYDFKSRIGFTKDSESEAEFTHPKRMALSASASLPQSVKSLAAIRLATESLISSEMKSSTAILVLPLVATAMTII